MNLLKSNCEISGGPKKGRCVGEMELNREAGLFAGGVLGDGFGTLTDSVFGQLTS